MQKPLRGVLKMTRSYADFFKTALIISTLTQLIFISYEAVYSRFSYFGGYFAPREIQFLEILILNFLLILFWGLSKSIMKNFSDFKKATCLWIFYLCLLPILVISVTSKNPLYYSIGPLCFFSGLLLAFYYTEKVNYQTTKSLLNNEILFIKAALLLSLILAVMTFIFFDAGNLNSIFQNIYSQRLLMRENMPFSGAGYIFYSTARFAVPFLLAYGFFRNKKIFIFIGIASGLYCFLIGGHKMIIGLMLLTFYLCIMQKKYSITKTIQILIILIYVIWIILEVFQMHIFVDLIYRRMLLLPGVLYTFYADQFIMSPNFFRSEAIDAGEIPFMIGNYYFDRSEMRANAGVITSSVINLGILGMLLTGLVMGFFLDWVQKLYKGFKDNNVRILNVLFLTYLLSFMDSALGVIVLTQGLFWLFFLRYSIGLVRWQS